MNQLISNNPATNEEIRRYHQMTDSALERALDTAEKRYQDWRQTTFSQRAQLLHTCADLLEERRTSYANIMTAEMGKTLTAAKAEVEKCAWVCRYYADHGADFLADDPVQTDASKSYISYQPMGVILAVMPWNYPFWQVFRYAAPTLMAGNVCLLKHASNVTGSALAIEEVLHDAGFPDGCFTTLAISSDRVKSIIEDDRVAAVTLTGSGPAGSAVASTAAAAIKPSVLELGGSDPYLILEDADLAVSAKACAASRLLNNGQSCIGAKRFIVTEAIYDEWLSLFTHEMKNAVMGPPEENETTLGPLARKDLRDEVHHQVEQSIQAGAELSLGGQIPDREGAYYPATVLTGVKPKMPAYDEEIFGPVASVIKVKDEAQAVAVANDTSFGLGAAVFTENIERGNRIAREELEAGCCFVNAYVKSDPRLPFGGIGQSGYGRELSHLGIRAFVNIKTVYIK